MRETEKEKQNQQGQIAHCTPYLDMPESVGNVWSIYRYHSMVYRRQEVRLGSSEKGE